MNIPHKTLLIASQNPGKVREFTDLLSPYGIAIKSALDFDLPEPEETGFTFHDNARLKAEYYASQTGLSCIADDSGLSIENLDGWPGVHTKDYANPENDYQLIREKLGPKDSKAQMVCVLALKSFAEPDVLFFEGRVEGQLVFPARGQGGFGVDPIFQPQGYLQTFAQAPELKKTLSHRARAMLKLLEHLKDKM